MLTQSLAVSNLKLLFRSVIIYEFYINVLLLPRRGIEPCRRIPETDNNMVDQGYEEPNVSEDITPTQEDVNDQYMELEDPTFAGYMNQLSN